VLALKDKLDIAELKGGGASKFGDLAGVADEVVNEVIGYVENDLGEAG
jgi:hypothetical protein